MTLFHRHLATALVGWLLVCAGAARGQDSQPAAAATDRPRCGVLLDDSLAGLATGPLFESAMLADPSILPVERTDLGKIINEQELTAMFSPDALAKRRTLGGLVKADVLVLVRRGVFIQQRVGDAILVPGDASPGPGVDWMDLVVCETRHGLRLDVSTVPITKDPKADCDALLKRVHAALARYRSGSRLIFSVLPFANQNLGHEMDPVETLLPSLLEQELLKKPGVLVVALPEARALAEEVALGGGEEPWRRLPYFITGEFSSTGLGKAARLNVNFHLHRAGRLVIDYSKRDLDLPEIPGALTAATSAFDHAATSAGPPPPTTQPESVVEACELAQQAEQFAREGDWPQVVTLGQAALLLDPSLVRVHGLLYAGLSHMAFFQFGRDGVDEPPRPGQLELALQYFTDSLPHLEIYMENTLVDRDYEHHSEARLMLYWRVIHLFLSASAAPDPRWIDADNAGRQALRRLLQYKSDHKIEDCSAEVCADFLSPVEVLRPVAPDQRDRVFWENAEVRLELLRQFSYRQDVEEMCKGLLWINGELSDAGWATLRKKIEAIGNPAILAEEDKLRVEGVALTKQRREQAEAQAREDAAPPPVIDHPDLTFAPVTMSTGADGNESARKCIGCIPINADMDFFWNESETFFMYKSSPGQLLRATGPNAMLPRGYPFVDPNHPLQQKLSATGVCFDGRLLWFIVDLEENSVVQSAGESYVITKPVGWALDAIDVKTHTGYLLTRSQGLPPAPRAIVPLAPGKVCVSGWFRRTWCAVATIDFDQTNVPNSIKVIYEGRELPSMAWDPDPSPSIAYEITYMTVLPPSAAQQKATTQPALPMVLARRGPGFFLIDPNSASVTTMPDPFPDRQTGSSATMAIGDNVFWQGTNGQSAAGLRHSTLDHLTPTTPAIDLSPGPLYFAWGMFNHVDPAKHEWSVSPDGVHPFHALRGWVPDSRSVPGRLAQSAVYGLLLMDCGKEHATYQANLLQGTTTRPATRQ